MGSSAAFAQTTHFVTSAMASGVLRPPYLCACGIRTSQSKDEAPGKRENAGRAR